MPELLNSAPNRKQIHYIVPDWDFLKLRKHFNGRSNFGDFTSLYVEHVANLCKNMKHLKLKWNNIQSALRQAKTLQMRDNSATRGTVMEDYFMHLTMTTILYIYIVSVVNNTHSSWSCTSSRRASKYAMEICWWGKANLSEAKTNLQIIK